MGGQALRQVLACLGLPSLCRVATLQQGLSLICFSGQFGCAFGTCSDAQHRHGIGMRDVDGLRGL